MSGVKTTTVKLPTDTLIKIKAMAVEKGTTQNNIINDLINKGLKATGKNGKIKAKFINNRLPKAKNVTKEYDSLKDMAGIIEVDENIDVNEVIDNIHFKKELY